MNANDLRELIMDLTEDIEFSYNGNPGSICPISATEINMAYKDNAYNANSIDAAMQEKLFEGKSLEEIAEKIIFD